MNDAMSSDKDNARPSVIVKDAIFSWDENEDSILTLVSLTIPTAKLTLVVGPVGSGKTTLISGMLGETKILRGHVTWSQANEYVGYVPQTPWLMNLTLRENICFGQPFIRRKYNSVISACCLQPDIDILPAGDLTEIGERGINLSGGQRQRVALARAIYSDTKTVILDDPLAALDAHVGAHVFEHAIKGLLLRHQKTVIMVTHKVEIFPQAAKIIVVDNGTIRHQGK